MNRFLGLAAVLAGSLGVLVSVAAIGSSWWAAARATARVAEVTGRLDHGLSEADDRLERVEERLASIRAELAGLRAEAERLTAENPELPRIQAAVERLLDKLLPTIDRAADLAASLRAVAAGLRAVEDMLTQLGREVEQPSRADAAADAIDRAAEALTVPRARVDAIKAATAVRLTQEMVDLARKAAAGSERLAEGLADSRREVTHTRERVGDWQRTVVYWVRVAAVVHTVVWVWVGLGQACLVGWGRRRMCGSYQPLQPGHPSGGGNS